MSTDTKVFFSALAMILLGCAGLVGLGVMAWKTLATAVCAVMIFFGAIALLGCSLED
jgi:hypothetical protein